MIAKVAKIWANSGLNYSFASKKDFSGKIDYHYLCISSKPHHPKTFQTNLSSQSLDKRLDNFGSNWI